MASTKKKAGAVKKPIAKKSPAKAKTKYVRPLKPGKKMRRRDKPVPLRIIRKPEVTKDPVLDFVPIDTKKAVAFGMSLVAELKKAKVREEKAKQAEANEIRLTRRPTSRPGGRVAERFPAADLKEFKKRLLAARQAADEGVSAMKATGFNETEDREADGGDGTAQSQRLQALGQMGSINRVILQIDEALHRIEDGSYGVCTVCGQLIRKQRLMNQPFVLTCMECQNELEREAAK